MRKRILVTGGAGFLGSHLCDKLLALGHEVVCLDNFFTGRRQNIEPLLDSHRFELVRQDICDPILFEVDEVYHLACPASPVHYQKNPVRTIRTCVQGTLNMLDMCRKVRTHILIAAAGGGGGGPRARPRGGAGGGGGGPGGPRAGDD